MNERVAFATTRDRIGYQPIVRDRRFRLPGGARVAVWTIVNVENWLPGAPMPRAVLPPPMGQPLLPDVPDGCCHLGQPGVIVCTGADILDLYRASLAH
jgi:hypothetical protein